jgi:methylase of polypeptide subunit release factors
MVPSATFAAEVRRALDSADYTERGIVERLDCGGTLRLTARERPRLLRHTQDGTPLDTFIRLFLLEADVTEAAARRAVAPTPLAVWNQAGLLACRGGRVSARFALLPQIGLRLLFDLRTHRPLRPDHVVGMGPVSRMLSSAIVRAPVRRALDLGTGCGGQALLLARHAERVVATDVNPRALAVTAFNAELNGIDNVELRRGSLFEPVAGQAFELVVANPPFAIGPSQELAFRDGGLPADGFVEHIVREAPAHLRPGAYCQLTAHWAQLHGEDWRSRLSRWVEGSGCDAWVLRLKAVSPETYAAGWITEIEQPEPEIYAQRWEEWVAYLERERIEAIGNGLVNLRRRASGDGRFWVLDDLEELDAGGGAAIAEGFAVRELLSGTSDDALLEMALHIGPGVRLESACVSSGEGWEVEGAVLRCRRGLHFSVSIDGAMANLVGRCDGVRTVCALAAELADGLRTDRAKLLGSLLPMVRGLLERGFLLPAAESLESALASSTGSDRPGRAPVTIPDTQQS